MRFPRAPCLALPPQAGEGQAGAAWLVKTPIKTQ